MFRMTEDGPLYLANSLLRSLLRASLNLVVVVIFVAERSLMSDVLYLWEESKKAAHNFRDMSRRLSILIYIDFN